MSIEFPSPGESVYGFLAFVALALRDKILSELRQ